MCSIMSVIRQPLCVKTSLCRLLSDDLDMEPVWVVYITGTFHNPCTLITLKSSIGNECRRYGMSHLGEIECAKYRNILNG